ncbi:hypothetical protein F5B22DRAFT_513212 [Xylaria bambusicola]|uniref:uncharacterized protein n=1 Tax=Xylaria bambusicola TaxID=326684 RepID=UPI002007C79D|nr:uncharacterized protein F5B22DRAFT_513212 [Xylaria bambusicola]KAI0522001.1 hypothetical protein F5B22DRAFT_513212 [Xylaria bambusicola]
MAGPLSIASGALSAIAATKQTVTVIYKFIRDCKEARSDLTRITRELSELTLILELIRDENTSITKDCLPNALQVQVQAMLASCTTTVQQIEETLVKCRGKPGPLLWTMFEKDKVTTLKGSLEAFKSGLSLALETVNLSISREIKNNTEMIQDTTVEIKHDTNQILNEIYKLRGQLPPAPSSDPEHHRLEQWLDNLTHYAETIVAGEERNEISDADDLIGHTGALWESDNSAAISTQPSEVTSRQDPLATTRRAPAAATGKAPISTSSDEGWTGTEDDSVKHAPKPSRAHSPKIKESAIKKQNQSNRESNQLPSSITFSSDTLCSPCSSKPVAQDYCAALDLWVTLHEDLVIRLWSAHAGKLRVFLPALQDVYYETRSSVVKLMGLNASVLFCPTRPELILVEIHRSKMEVWDWEKGVRIQTPERFIIKGTMSWSTLSWTRFVPQSTIIYVRTSDNYLKLVDLVAPSKLWKISLAEVLRSVYKSVTSEYLVEMVRFVSESEIFVLGKRHPPALGFWRARSQRHARAGWLIQLPVVSTDELGGRASLSTKYSITVMSGSEATAHYAIPQGLISVSHLTTIGDKRWLTVSGTWKLRGSEGKTTLKRTQIINLDTGTPVSNWNVPWLCAVHPYKFAILGPTSESASVINLEDLSELGTLPSGWHFSPSNTDKIALIRYVNSNIEFRMVDVVLEKPARQRQLLPQN